MTDELSFEEISLAIARDRGILHLISAMLEKSPKLYARVNPTGTFVLKSLFSFYEGAHFILHEGKNFIINDPLFQVIDPIHKSAEWNDERLKNFSNYKDCKNYEKLDGSNYCLFNSVWSGGNFAHMIGESFSKISLLANVYDIDSLIFLIPEWVKFYKEIFELLGLNYKLISRDTIYTGEIYVPSLVNHNTTTSMGAHLFLKEVFKRIPDNIALVNKNIFISRKKAGKRHIINEDEVIYLIRKYIEIEIVYLEDLKFSDQLSLVRNSNLIIAPHGAGLQLSTLQERGILIEIHSPYYINWSFVDTYRSNSVRAFNLFCKDLLQDESQINKIGYRDQNYNVDLHELSILLDQVFFRKGNVC